MSNAFFADGIKGFAEKSISWTVDTIKAALINSSFVPTYDTNNPQNINNASHWSDISANQVGSSVALSGRSDTAGILAASDITFTAVTGVTAVRVVVYQDTGTPATSLLILAFDSAGGLPVVPNGGDIAVHWDTGAYKIAQI